MHLRNEHIPGKKVVVLSNGAHLDSKKVVTGMNSVDERVIKVDAGSDNLMQKVNDPLVRINMAKFLTGVRKLSDCVVQSLFVTGDVNNTANEQLDEWIEVIGMIKPRSVQLCTVTRPGFMPGVRDRVQAEKTHRLRKSCLCCSQELAPFSHTAPDLLRSASNR